MVVQQKLNDLKGAPHEDKKVVATSIAVTVVVILIFVWGFVFFRNVQRTDIQSLENGAVPTDQFNMDLLRGPSERDDAYYDPTDDIRELRNNTQVEAGASSGSSVTPGASDDFGNSGGF